MVQRFTGLFSKTHVNLIKMKFELSFAMKLM